MRARVFFAAVACSAAESAKGKESVLKWERFRETDKETTVKEKACVYVWVGWGGRRFSSLLTLRSHARSTDGVWKRGHHVGTLTEAHTCTAHTFTHSNHNKKICKSKVWLLKAQYVPVIALVNSSGITNTHSHR